MDLDKIVSKAMVILLVALFLYEFGMALAIAHVDPFCICYDDAYCVQCPEGIMCVLPEQLTGL